MPKWWELCVFSHNELLHHNESKNCFQSNYLVIFDNSNAHNSAKPDTIWTDSDIEEKVKTSTILPWSDPQAILHLQPAIGPYSFWGNFQSCTKHSLHNAQLTLE